MRKFFITCYCCFMSVLAMCAQDIIITNESKKIEAKILEVSKNEIKYKEQNYLDGPTFTLETSEINTIIYSNGKVVAYNQDKPVNAVSEEPKAVKTNIENKDDFELYVGLQGYARQTLIDYLDGYPKNIVAIKGDYSMLLNKKSTVYFDFEYDSAKLVEYSPLATDYIERGDFNQYLNLEHQNIDKNSILQTACDLYKQKMMGKKCKLLPIYALDATSANQLDGYKMTLHILHIDVGSGTVSVMTSGRTSAGGAIIYGCLEIKQLATDTPCAILIVDRVQGIGVAYESLRIQNVIEEIIANKLFFIKEFKLYTKDMN